MELQQLSPPYDSPAESITIDRLRPLEGAVLVLHLTPRTSAVRHIQVVRRRAPWAPLLVVTPASGGIESVPPGVVAGTGAHVASAGIEVNERNLRAVLAGVDDFSHVIAPWLRHVRPLVTARSLEYIRRLLHRSESGSGAESVLPERTINRWLATDGLPSSGWWRAGGAVIRGVLALQRDPRATLQFAAFATGYADASGFSRACLRYFGRSPSELRRLIGWNWMLWEALLLNPTSKARLPRENDVSRRSPDPRL